MTTLAAVFGISCVLCLILTPLVRRYARRYGLVDRPDGRRKIHARAIPVAGGIAVFFSGTLAMVAAVGASPLRDRIVQHTASLLGLLVAACVICAVGVVDDFRGLRGRHKLFGQLVAVSIVMSCGVMVQQVQLFEWRVDLGLLAVPFTMFFILGAINSLNLLDGMDGLLSSIALIISVAMAIMAIMTGHWAMACVAAALAGSLLGFLRYNFPPASIFLGDSGSMVIGLVVGVLAIQSSLKGPATVALAAPLAVLTIPIFDTLAAIVRRKLTGRSLYSTDRGHLHHCLLRRGLSTRRVLTFVSFFCLVAMIGALGSMALHNELLAILSGLVIAGIMILTRFFGYAEFLLIRDHLTASAVSLFRQRSTGTPQSIEVRLQGTADWTTVWQELTASAEKMNLRTLRLDVNAPSIHEGYVALWSWGISNPEEHDLWRAQIPFSADGQSLGCLQIVGERDQESILSKLAKLATVVENLELAVSTASSTARAQWPPDPQQIAARESNGIPTNAASHEMRAISREGSVTVASDECLNYQGSQCTTGGSGVTRAPRHPK